MWGAVIFYVVQYRGIEPTEGFFDLVSGGSQGAVASGGVPLGAYFVISKDLGGCLGGGRIFLILRCPHVDSSCYQYSCQVSNGRDRSGDDLYVYC